MPLHIARRLSGLVLSGGGTAVSVYGVSDGVAFGSRYLLGEVIGRGAMGPGVPSVGEEHGCARCGQGAA